MMRIKLLILSVLLSVAAIAQPPSGPSITRQGNLFNGPNQLIRTNSLGLIPGVVIPGQNEWEIISYTPPFYDDILFDSSGGVNYRRVLINGGANARWWGAIGFDAVDDYDEIQEAIDACIASNYVTRLNLDAGTFILSEGLVVRKQDPVEVYATYNELTIYGVDNSYNGGTILQCTDGDEAILMFHKSVGGGAYNIKFKGGNYAPSTYDMIELVADSSTFLSPGISNNQRSPHAGIVIDPFYTSAAPQKYASKSEFYVESSGNRGGSSRMKIVDCYFEYLTVGIAISPGGMQNGEDIDIIRPTILDCRVGISSGDVQNREINIQGLRAWGPILYVCDSYTYSPGSAGCGMTVTDFNISAGVKWFYRVGSFYDQAYRFYNGFSEETYGIGGCWEGRETAFYMAGVSLRLLGSQYTNSTRIRNSNQLLQAFSAHITSSTITYYDKHESLLGFSTSTFNVEGSSYFSSPYLIPASTQGRNSFLHIEDNSNILLENLNATSSTNTEVTISSINAADDTYQFTTGVTIEEGAYVKLYPKTAGQLNGEFNYSSAFYIPAGKVTDVTGTTITVTGIPYELTNGMVVDVITTKYTFGS